MGQLGVIDQVTAKSGLRTSLFQHYICCRLHYVGQYRYNISSTAMFYNVGRMCSLHKENYIFLEGMTPLNHGGWLKWWDYLLVSCSAYIRDRSPTLVKGGTDTKKRPLKFLTFVMVALKKITTNFPVKIEFTCFSMGLTHNFHSIKGGPWNFLRFEKFSR